MTPDEREDFEERAAIIEEGNPGMTRAEAERIALQGIIERRQPAPVAQPDLPWKVA